NVALPIGVGQPCASEFRREGGPRREPLPTSLAVSRPLFPPPALEPHMGHRAGLAPRVDAPHFETVLALPGEPGKVCGSFLPFLARTAAFLEARQIWSQGAKVHPDLTDLEPAIEINLAAVQREIHVLVGGKMSRVLRGQLRLVRRIPDPAVAV